MSDEQREAFISCGCHIEGVQVCWWPSGEVYMSMWETKHYDGRKMPWRQRIRAIGSILRRGEPYKDQITLSHPEAERLADALRGGGVERPLAPQWSYTGFLNTTGPGANATASPASIEDVST